MSLAQKMHFLLDVFQMSAVMLISVMNHYHIYGLHLFWDTLYICVCVCVYVCVCKVYNRSRGRPEGSLFSSYYTEL